MITPTVLNAAFFNLQFWAHADLADEEVHYIVAFLESLEGELPVITVPPLPAD